MNNENDILVIIDMQNSFMDSPNHMGSLAVPGAYQDALRLTERIKNKPPKSILATLDTHARMHIAHALWWVNDKNEHPEPFTLIIVEDIQNGTWKAVNPEMQDYSLFYAKQLAEQKKYELRIWPYHCIENTLGHQIEENLLAALIEWEKITGNKVTYVRKGTNPKTEHYSVFKAEVIDEKDKATKLNIELINFINSHKKVSFTGEASSHCLPGSLMDYLENIPREDINKVSLFKDCTSPVSGYEKIAQEFIEKFTAMGVHVINSTEGKKLKM